MVSRENPPDGHQPGGRPKLNGWMLAYIVFKMATVSAMVGMGVFLIIMGGLHPAALMKASLFTAPDSPLAFRLAWQTGLGAALITFAFLWLRMR